MQWLLLPEDIYRYTANTTLSPKQYTSINWRDDITQLARKQQQTQQKQEQQQQRKVMEKKTMVTERNKKTKTT